VELLPPATEIGGVSPPMMLLLAIVVFAYFRRVHTLVGDPRRSVPLWRQAIFVCSILVLLVEPLTPLGAWDERSFTAHMLEHLLIGDFASLLMVLGLTGPLIAPLLRNPVIDFLRPLTHPVPAFILWVANLYFWHLPFAFDGALSSDWIHVVQHICFFSVGFNVWMALFGPLPKPEWFGNIAKLIYLVLLRMASVVLGNVFIFSGSVFYTSYEGADNPFGMTALGDQITAGSVMMAEGSIVTFTLLGWLFFTAAKQGEESQQLREHASEHGVELSGSRSDRAAAAGTGDFLRERISSASPLDKDGDQDVP
jgi:cytochrome c oxidase assembly factor CtaG